MFLEKVIDSGRVIYSDLLPEVEHFFTTRESSLNSERNLELTANYLGVGVSELVSPTQVHGENIEFAEVGKSLYPGTDSLILTNKEQGIYLRFADCVPVVIYDKARNIGAIAHAGWRGTVSKIVPKTIIKMGSVYSDVRIVIGPAIGACCYSVGEEVLDGVSGTVRDISGLFRGGHVDLKLANARQAVELGVSEDNIDICPYCTSCRNDMFYSYRKENGTLNRHNAVLKLRF